MENDNLKFVEFGKYCESCKHNYETALHNPNAGVYDGEKRSGILTKEEYAPCCYCLEEAAREGTEVPLHWEAK